jgi:hypothetical protein
MSERWLPILGWDGFYEVSDLGNVRSVDRMICHANGSLHRHAGRVLRPTANNKGYLSIGLQDAQAGRKSFCTVHRLVAAAFLENPEGLPEVNHKDGCKLNCAANNLEWVSSSANSLHAAQHGLSHKRTLTDEQVSEILSRHSAGEAKKALARAYGVDPKTIRSIVSGETYSWVRRPSTETPGEWRDIATAPRDGTNILLWYPGVPTSSGYTPPGKAIRGLWERDIYAKVARPYWRPDDSRTWGIIHCRTNPPTHWMPLPSPPSPLSAIPVGVGGEGAGSSSADLGGDGFMAATESGEGH